MLPVGHLGLERNIQIVHLWFPHSCQVSPRPVTPQNILLSFFMPGSEICSETLHFGLIPDP